VRKQNLYASAAIVAVVVLLVLNHLYLVTTLWGLRVETEEMQIINIVTMGGIVAMLTLITLQAVIANPRIKGLGSGVLDWTKKPFQVIVTAIIVMAYQLGSASLAAFGSTFEAFDNSILLNEISAPTRLLSALLSSGSPNLALSFYIGQSMNEEAIFTGLEFFGLQFMLMLVLPMIFAAFGRRLRRGEAIVLSVAIATLITAFTFAVFHSWAYLGIPIGEAARNFPRYWAVFFSVFTTQIIKCFLAWKDDTILGCWIGHAMGNFIISGAWAI